VIRPLLLHNGVIRSAHEPLFSPGQVGFLNGWGVFSTVKVVDGVLFEFPRHWARMRRDAAQIRVHFPWDAGSLEEMLLRLVEANEDYNSTLRLAVIRNRGTMFEGPGIERDAELIAFTAPRANWGQAVRLGVAPAARHAAGRFTGAKISAWAQNLCWYEEAHERGFDEVVLLNEREEVSECTSANIFAVFGDRVLTPPLESGCLPGVTRQILLEEIAVPGWKIEEGTLTLASLERAGEVFITSSTRDLLPVESIERLTIAQGRAASPALSAAFAAYEAAYVQSAARRAGPVKNI
jgi:branched-chain amino acid aminotransferase